MCLESAARGRDCVSRRDGGYNTLAFGLQLAQLSLITACNSRGGQNQSRQTLCGRHGRRRNTIFFAWLLAKTKKKN